MPSFEEIVGLWQQGKLLIGVDRALARKFFMDVSISEVVENTGEAPYFEKMIIWLAFLAGYIGIITSIILGFFAFGWLGVVSLIFCPMFFFYYLSLSSTPKSKLTIITICLILSIGVNFFIDFNYLWIARFISVFLFSLWFARLLYCCSAIFFRNFVTWDGGSTVGVGVSLGKGDGVTVIVGVFVEVIVGPGVCDGMTRG